MIDHTKLQYGNTIWQIDISGTTVTLRKITVGHLTPIAGSYWVSAEQEHSQQGIMLKVDSPYLFDSKERALKHLLSIRDSADMAIMKGRFQE